MTTTEDLFQQLGKSKYFSKFDFSKKYWSISVAKIDIEKTAFMKPDGSYDFLRRPFEMKNLEPHWCVEKVNIGFKRQQLYQQSYSANKQMEVVIADSTKILFASSTCSFDGNTI